MCKFADQIGLPGISSSRLLSTGASRVVVFDHKVRHAASNWHSLGKNNASKRGPLHRVHVDQSPAGALTELTRRLPEDAEELQSRRFQIINVGARCSALLAAHFH
jgi:hypothetical protein